MDAFYLTDSEDYLIAHVRKLTHQGIYPLLLRGAEGLRIVELDSRDVLEWITDPSSLPANRLVGFPCHKDYRAHDLSVIEKERLALVTATFLELGYVKSDQLHKLNGVSWYMDWPNATGLQFSMGMTDSANGRMQTSLRLVLPALSAYELHDLDEFGQPRTTLVARGELPIHGLLEGEERDRVSGLASRHNVQVVGELSQLVSLAGSAKVIQDVCSVFGAFACAVASPKYCRAVFEGGKGVALSVSAVPRLAEILAKMVETRLAPRVAPLAQISLEKAGSPVWRRGTLEVPMLLCVNAKRDL
jgi:hypothetical protein